MIIHASKMDYLESRVTELSNLVSRLAEELLKMGYAVRREANGEVRIVPLGDGK